MFQGNAGTSEKTAEQSSLHWRLILIMSQMNMIQAINSAHDVMMEKDPTVVVFGQDVGYFGGVFPLHRRPAEKIR